MSLIEIEHHDNVAVLKLNNGITNPLNLEFITEISEKINKIAKDPAVRGLVLTSNNEKFFSIGFDIPKLYELPRDELELFYKTFNRLCIEVYTLPKPVLAAITGHAIAGGCILSICCDYRYIADGKKLMGLNEIKLGLPVPFVADRVLRQLVGDRYAHEIMFTGDFYQPSRSYEMGLVDQVLPMEKVLSTAIEKAGNLGAVPNKALAMIKQNHVQFVKEQISKWLEQKEANFLECWNSDETQKLIVEAIKKF